MNSKQFSIDSILDSPPILEVQEQQMNGLSFDVSPKKDPIPTRVVQLGQGKKRTNAKVIRLGTQIAPTDMEDLTGIAQKIKGKLDPMLFNGRHFKCLDANELFAGQYRGWLKTNFNIPTCQMLTKYPQRVRILPILFLNLFFIQYIKTSLIIPFVSKYTFPFASKHIFVPFQCPIHFLHRMPQFIHPLIPNARSPTNCSHFMAKIIPSLPFESEQLFPQI